MLRRRGTAVTVTKTGNVEYEVESKAPSTDGHGDGENHALYPPVLSCVLLRRHRLILLLCEQGYFVVSAQHRTAPRDGKKNRLTCRNFLMTRRVLVFDCKSCASYYCVGGCQDLRLMVSA